MSRIAAKVLTICLLAVPTAVLGQGTVFPLTGPPDIYVDDLTYSVASGADGTYLNLSGTSVILPNRSVLSGGAVESISDVAGTWCFPSAGNGEAPCTLGGLAIAFSTTATTFAITGQTIEAYNANTSQTTTYLTGALVPGSFVQQLFDGHPDGEYGELFTVTYDNTDEMNELEEAFPSALGTQPATNFDATEIGDEVFLDFDAVSNDADIEIEAPGQAPEPGTLTLLGSGLAATLLRKRLARKKAKA